MSGKKVWVAGDVRGFGNVVPGAMLWNGRSQSFHSLKAPRRCSAPCPTATGGIWAVAQDPGAVADFRPEIWHFTHGRWQSSHIPGSDGADFIDQFAAVPGTRPTWAVGRFKSGRLEPPAILLDGRIPR